MPVLNTTSPIALVLYPNPIPSKSDPSSNTNLPLYPEYVRANVGIFDPRLVSRNANLNFAV
jgi:hypothetical protein